MNEQERAEEHLKTIRRLMERAAIYRAISAPTALVGGLLSLAVSCFYIIWLRSHPRDIVNPGKDIFVPLWMVVLVLTGVTNLLIITKGAQSRGEPVFSASMKAAVFALMPGIIAGAALSTLFVLSNLDCWSDFGIALAWSGCYGLALLATGNFAPRSLVFMGWGFFISGVGGLLVTRLSEHLGSSLLYTNSSIAGAAFMAVTFGFIHLIYALCVWPRPGATSEP